MADLTSAARNATTHARRWWDLAVLCLSVLLAAIDNTFVNVALPTLSRWWCPCASWPLAWSWPQARRPTRS